ncbi:MAG: DNA cytosine methyltransferase [Chromatiales bacterium]|nr:DNA cytosine methyltransferase [Chromatiales bacterium]
MLQSRDFEGMPGRWTFIDLFAGCGGLSLGLSQAGWKGRFAVEQASDAFETFRENFLKEGSRYPFEWPSWLEQKAHSINDLLEKNSDHLCRLRGRVDLVAGAPPCQGFSFAGKRNASDSRNKLAQRYVDFVELVQPKFLLLENVPGMNIAHKYGRGKSRHTYYQKLQKSLSLVGYVVSGRVFDAADFGVPQRRARLIAVGVRSDVAAQLAKVTNSDPAGVLEAILDSIRDVGRRQLSRYGQGHHVSAFEAISDLAVGSAKKRNTEEYVGDGRRRGYRQVKYQGPVTRYQIRMGAGVPLSGMDSMRLARHREDVESRFERILATCRPGVSMSAEARAHLGMLKHRTVPMHRDKPSPTLTTLPDDIIHYSDPRILTVREYARIQSFPDWFRFKGKYTTGGTSRRHECPRYTQVGNAVPPLLGEAIGSGLMSYASLCSIAKSRIRLFNAEAAPKRARTGGL